jgi:uncharacterized DUF497 family protein
VICAIIKPEELLEAVLNIYYILWKEEIIEKLHVKHNIVTDEVEEVLFGKPLIRFWEKGKVAGDNLYIAYGQTDAGRYLVVFFIQKDGNVAFPISARDMTRSERRYYRG